MMSRIEGITRGNILGLEWHYQFHKMTCWHFYTLFNTENIFSNNLCSTISPKNSRWKKKNLDVSVVWLLVFGLVGHFDDLFEAAAKFFDD